MVGKIDATDYLKRTSVNVAFTRNRAEVLLACKNSQVPVYDSAKVLELARVIIGFDPATRPPLQKVSRHWLLEYITFSIFKAGPNIEETPLYFDVLEKGCIAALELGRVSVGEAFLGHIEATFPPQSSRRSRRLRGMVLEARGEYSNALKYYEACLSDWGYTGNTQSLEKRDDAVPVPPETSNTHSPHIALVLKRITAIHKARGDLCAAVSSLCGYLDTFQIDVEAWFELFSLYVEMARNCKDELQKASVVNAAIYCIEEAILLDPQNHLFLISLASVQLALAKRPKEALRNYLRVVSLFNGQISRVPVAVLTGIVESCECLREAKDTSLDASALSEWVKLAKASM